MQKRKSRMWYAEENQNEESDEQKNLEEQEIFASFLVDSSEFYPLFSYHFPIALYFSLFILFYFFPLLALSYSSIDVLKLINKYPADIVEKVHERDRYNKVNFIYCYLTEDCVVAVFRELDQNSTKI